MTKCIVLCSSGIVEKGELYKNANWLKKVYVDDKKSAYKIAKEFNCTPRTILNWIKKFGIKSRSKSEAGRLNSSHVYLSKEAIEFLEGLLLGDGHLCTNNWSGQYMDNSKYGSYVEWLLNKFIDYGVEGRIKRHERPDLFPDGKLHHYISFFYSSKCYAELGVLQKRWYREAREDEVWGTGRRKKWIKIIPPDLALPPLTCLMWYIGDGSFICRSIRLCTDGFTIPEIDFLRDKLGELGFETTRHKSGNIHILTKSTKAFLDYIGECPIKCYKYKWIKVG